VQHGVKVIAEHGVGADADGEDVGELGELLHHPALAVVEVVAGSDIVATKEGTPHATADAMVVRRRVDIDLRIARAWHELRMSG